MSKHDSLIADAERLCLGAAPGPWRVENVVGGQLDITAANRWGILASCVDNSDVGFEDHHGNAAFIAWARSGVPALIAALRESEADRERMRRGLVRLSGETPDPTCFAFWPWSLSISEVQIAHYLWSWMTKIASNLLAGREWDGEAKP